MPTLRSELLAEVTIHEKRVKKWKNSPALGRFVTYNPKHPATKELHRLIDQYRARLLELADLVEQHPEALDYPIEPLFAQPDARDAWVYFIRRDFDGAIKIGFSVDPEKRLAALFTGAGKCTLLASCLGGSELETQLHRRFASARIAGEWFRPVPELVQFMLPYAR